MSAARIVGLTAARARVLEAITAHVLEHARPPTQREIGRRAGIASTNGVDTVLRVLVRDGLVERTPLQSRGLRITDRGRAHLTLWREAHPALAAAEEA